MAFLELKDIRKSYYLGKEEFPVLKGIDLDFELGEFVSILGESGGGKSTLMNIIGGLDCEFEGKVTIDGQVLDHKKEKQLDAYRRGTIGYIYQAYNLISHLTVLENVLVSLEMTTLSQKDKTARATELLEKVGLKDQIKKHPNQLSGGQSNVSQSRVRWLLTPRLSLPMSQLVLWIQSIRLKSGNLGRNCSRR